MASSHSEDINAFVEVWCENLKLRRYLGENPVFTCQKNSVAFIKIVEEKQNKLEIKFLRKNVSHDPSFAKFF